MTELKNILVTGGAGYVGAVLVPKLLNAGYRVRVLDLFLFKKDLFRSLPKNNLEMMKGDIRDKKLIKKSLKGIDAVIHLACISNDPSFELDPNLGKSINYEAAKYLIDEAKEAGVKRFINASTSSVYGVKKEKEVSEDLPLVPLTDYSKYKALIEKYLLKKQSPKFTVLILRPATVCGYSDRMRFDLTVNLLTIQALVNKNMTVFGGSQMRPNIHIEDMADLYLKTLEYPDILIAGKIFNAGQENYSVLAIAKMIKKVLKIPSITIEILPSNDNRSYRISSQKIYEELKFKAKRSVEEAISDIKNAYLRGKIPDPLTDASYYNIKTMIKFVDDEAKQNN